MSRIRSTFDAWLVIDKKAMPPAERQACEDYLDRRDFSYQKVLAWAALAYNVIAMGLELFLARPRALPILAACHVTVLLLLLAWRHYRERIGPRRYLFGWSMQLITIGTYAYLTRTSLLLPDPYTLGTFIGWTIVFGLMFVATLMGPSRGAAPAMAALCSATGFYVWSALPTGDAVAFINMLVLLFAVLLRSGLTKRAWEEARLELTLAADTLAAEETRMARELELARQVQDSMLPPASLRLGRFEARFHLLRHHSVGGDWFGVRTLADGRSVVVICDASGKGVRAAIVLHAVQSLWAEALDQPTFDAARWLARVNLCLLRLGKRQRHGATIGIVVLAAHEATYWSAGHLPLFVLQRGAAGKAVQRLAPHGDMLGVAADFEVESATLPLPPDFDGALLLVTDGVVPKASQLRSAEITRLVESVEREGAGAIGRVASEDDKAAVLLRTAA